MFGPTRATHRNIGVGRASRSHWRRGAPSPTTAARNGRPAAGHRAVRWRPTSARRRRRSVAWRPAFARGEGSIRRRAATEGIGPNGRTRRDEVACGRRSAAVNDDAAAAAAARRHFARQDVVSRGPAADRMVGRAGVECPEVAWGCVWRRKASAVSSSRAEGRLTGRTVGGERVRRAPNDIGRRPSTVVGVGVDD